MEKIYESELAKEKEELKKQHQEELKLLREELEQVRKKLEEPEEQLKKKVNIEIDKIEKSIDWKNNDGRKDDEKDSIILMRREKNSLWFGCKDTTIKEIIWRERKKIKEEVWYIR